jgi:fatty acid desaturase
MNTLARTTNDGGGGPDARRRRLKPRAELSRPLFCYRFPAPILDRVKACRANDNYHGLRELVEDWCVIITSIYGAVLAWDTDWRLGLPAYCLALALIGGRQRALADILHQCSHGTLTKNTRLGNVLGTVCSGYLVLQSLSGYRLSHVYQHHRYLGDPELDPDYLQYQKWGICGANRSSSGVRRHFARTLSPSTTLSYLIYLLKYRILPEDESGAERIFRLSYIAVIAATAVAFGYGQMVLLFWLVPLVTTQAWIGSFLEIVEHYPMIECDGPVDICMSRNRRCGWFSSFILGLQQYDGYHLVHHKFPFIPSWRLTEAHEILMEDDVYRKLNRDFGWKAILRSILNPEACVTQARARLCTPSALGT